MTEHKSNFPEFYITAPQPCPYLPGRLERKLFTHLSPDRPGFLIDNLLKGGFRRSQNIAYMPSCDGCSACVPVRIVVDEFEPAPLAQADRRRQSRSASPRACRPHRVEQYALFRGYIEARHADGGMADMRVLDYSIMVEDSAVETLRHRIPARSRTRTAIRQLMAAVACATGSATASRMVYSFYDPEHAGAQPRHLHDPRPCRLRPGARPAVRLSRLLDRGLAQDGLQGPLPAAGATHLRRAGCAA